MSPIGKQPAFPLPEGDGWARAPGIPTVADGLVRDAQEPDTTAVDRAAALTAQMLRAEFGLADYVYVERRTILGAGVPKQEWNIWAFSVGSVVEPTTAPTLAGAVALFRKRAHKARREREIALRVAREIREAEAASGIDLTMRDDNGRPLVSIGVSGINGYAQSGESIGNTIDVVG